MRRRKRFITILLVVGFFPIFFGSLWFRARSNAVALVAASAAGNDAEVRRLLSVGVPAAASYSSLTGLNSGEPSITVNVPILAAAERGHTATIDLLLASGADIEAANEWGETAIIIAARKDRYDAVETLIKHGANINARCERGRTPLLWAVGYASPRVVVLLLDNKARGGVDSVGLSILDLASRRPEPQRQEILDLLKATGSK